VLITQFNKLIRNKIVWSVFAFIIAFFFVGASVTSRGCGSPDQQHRGAEGRLFDKDVASSDFFAARYFELGLRSNRPLTSEENAILRNRTWARLAALHLADKLQVSASPAEIQAVLQKDPGFSRNGVFDADLYRSTVTSQLRITPQMYEQYLQQEISLKKIHNTVASMVWIPPIELEERLRDLTDIMTAEYVVISNRETIAAADVTAEQAREFFEEHNDLFRVPDTIRVKYVQFPVSNCLGTVEIAEDDVVDFYNDNLDDYSTVDTNGFDSFRPLEEVRDEILAALQWREATFEAMNRATDFATQLGTDRYGRATSLEEAIANSGLTVHTSDYFSATEAVEGVDAGTTFTRAAFALDVNDKDNYFSDAIVGEHYVYIAMADDAKEAHDATFEDVRDEVLSRTAVSIREDNFSALLDEMSASIMEQMSETQTFAQVVSEMGFNVYTSAPLSVYDSYTIEDLHTRILPTALAEVRDGELTKPIPLDEGDAVILAHRTSRQPGDLVSAQMIRPQLIQMLTRYRASLLVSEWSKDLLDEAELEDLRPVITMDDGEEEPDDEEEASDTEG